MLINMAAEWNDNVNYPVQKYSPTSSFLLDD